MPSPNYYAMFGGYGTPGNPFTYTSNAGLSYHPLGGGATSSGPYDPSSALGSAYQVQSFNLGESDRLGKLGDIINQMNRNAQKQSLQARIPNAPALETKSSANIGSELGGQVPQDVMNLLGQEAAERGVATGAVGSPNANAAYLRALGLTSLQEQQQGQADLTRAYARNPAAPIFDPTTQLITPYQGALISEANAANNLGVNRLLQSGNIAQQELNLERLRYASPSLNYGGTTTGTNPLTGADLFEPETYSASTGGGTSGTGFTYSIPGDAFQGNFYDYTPPSPLPSDYGIPDYASTPVSMYG